MHLQLISLTSPLFTEVFSNKLFLSKYSKNGPFGERSAHMLGFILTAKSICTGSATLKLVQSHTGGSCKAKNLHTLYLPIPLPSPVHAAIGSYTDILPATKSISQSDR